MTGPLTAAGLRTDHQEIAVLLLTRCPGKSIIIETPTGEHIQVAVLGINGNQGRVGTEGPADVTILQEELL